VVLVVASKKKNTNTEQRAINRKNKKYFLKKNKENPTTNRKGDILSFTQQLDEKCASLRLFVVKFEAGLCG